MAVLIRSANSRGFQWVPTTRFCGEIWKIFCGYPYYLELSLPLLWACHNSYMPLLQICLCMYRCFTTKSPIFILLCGLCFQGQPFRFLSLILLVLFLWTISYVTKLFSFERAFAAKTKQSKQSCHFLCMTHGYSINCMHSDRLAWANSIDTDAVSHQGLHCLPLIQQFLDTTSGNKLYWIFAEIRSVSAIIQTFSAIFQTPSSEVYRQDSEMFRNDSEIFSFDSEIFRYDSEIFS